MIKVLLLLASHSWAWTPIPTVSTAATRANFLDLAQEFQRRDLTKGGTIRGPITISSKDANGFSLTVSSGIDVGGCIHYGDGTYACTGSGSGGGGSVSNPISSYTFVPETIVTQNSFIVSIVTVTMSVGAVPLKVKLNASVLNNSIQESCWSFLIDGQHYSTLSSTVGVRCEVPVANQCFNLGGEYIIPAQTAGSHTFGLMLATQSGTNIKVLARGTSCSGGTLSADAQFGVEEFLGNISTSGVQTNVANNFAAPITMTASSITLNGASGNILSGASVTASAFFGDPSHLIGIAMATASVQKSGDSMTGQLTNASSITVTGSGGIKAPNAFITSSLTSSSGTFTNTGATSYAISLSSGINFTNGAQINIPSGGYIKWSDGSVSTTGAGSGGGSSSSVSSFTYLPGGVFTNGQLGPCLSGSTITLTLTTNPVDVVFSGSVGYNSTHESSLSFLVDGAFVSPLSTGTPVIIPAPISTQCQNASFRYRLSGLSATSHTFCLTGANNTGAATLTVTGTSQKCPYENGWATASQFGVQEIK